MSVHYSFHVWLHKAKIEHPVTCLATMACFYAVCAVCVIILSIYGKFWLVSNFTKLHTLCGCHSYALLHAKDLVNSVYNCCPLEYS